MIEMQLKSLRKKHDITQVQFAKIFNISNGTIAMWETGKREPDIAMLLKISEYFSISIDYLLTGKEKNSVFTEHSTSSAYNDEELLILSNYRALNDEGHNYIARQFTFALSQPEYKKDNLNEMAPKNA